MKIFVSTSLAVAALSATQTDAAFPNEVTSLMDTAADPCEDFFQYSCGTWVKNFTLTADKPAFSYLFDGIAERHQPAVQDILKQDWPIIGEFYESCVNLDQLTALGNKPLQKDLAKTQMPSRHTTTNAWNLRSPNTYRMRRDHDPGIPAKPIGATHHW